MIESYRTSELEKARAEQKAARERYAALRAKGWSKKTRDAADILERWGNRVAFLNAVRGDQP